MELGAVLQAELPWLDETYYFINAPQGRAAVQAIQSGTWQDTGQPRQAIQIAPEKPNIFKLYESNIGSLTPMVAEILKARMRPNIHPNGLKKPFGRPSHEMYATGSMSRKFYQAGKKKDMAMSKIDETVNRIRKTTGKAGSGMTDHDQGEEIRQVQMPGDPNCPICHGIGWLRRDLPIDHSGFRQDRPL